MKITDAKTLLEERIRLAELERDKHFVLLKEQMKITMEHLHPLQVLKDAFTSSNAKNTMVDSAIGMTSGYLVKKAVVRSSKNPLLKLLGSALGLGVANFVRKHPDGIKFLGGRIINKFFGPKPERTQ